MASASLPGFIPDKLNTIQPVKMERGMGTGQEWVPRSPCGLRALTSRGKERRRERACLAS